MASSSRPRRSLVRLRENRRIQKIIQVTKTTARIDVTASNSSLPLMVEQVLGDVGQDGAEPDREHHRGADADPDLAEALPPARLHQERDQDADDQSRLQPLPEPDEVAAEQCATHRSLRGTFGQPTLT